MKARIRCFLILCFAVMLAFCLASCTGAPENTGNGGGSGQQTESEPDPKTEDEPDDTEQTKAYDVSEGMQTVASEDGSIEYIYFNDFMITMPNNDKWSYDMTQDSVTFYLFSAQQEGYGGRLVTIRAYDLNDESYKQLPSYHVAGIGQNVDKRFIAEYPTDVQWNGNDKTQDADYRELQAYLQKIGDNAVNSPVQTSDGD